MGTDHTHDCSWPLLMKGASRGLGGPLAVVAVRREKSPLSSGALGSHWLSQTSSPSTSAPHKSAQTGRSPFIFRFSPGPFSCLFHSLFCFQSHLLSHSTFLVLLRLCKSKSHVNHIPVCKPCFPPS